MRIYVFETKVIVKLFKLGIMAINEEEIISEVWNDLFIDNIGIGIFEDSTTENDHEKDVDLGKIFPFFM